MTVRVAAEDAGFVVDHILIAAAAVDLAESLDTRESAAGIRILEELLERYRSGDARQRISGRRDK